MPNRSDAEEHLRIIRSLMEKATIYRAISAPTAFVAGITAVLVAVAFHRETGRADAAIGMANSLFVGGWLTALAVAGLANGIFLWRDAVRRGDQFLSPGMRAAFLALAPNYLVAGALTFLWGNSAHLLAAPWIILHALGLLATQYFAPSSIVRLGWAFLAAGLGVLVVFSWPHDPLGSVATLRICNLAMGATFGLFHLIYAACTWPRRGREAGVGA